MGEARRMAVRCAFVTRAFLPPRCGPRAPALLETASGLPSSCDGTRSSGTANERDVRRDRPQSLDAQADEPRTNRGSRDDRDDRPVDPAAQARHTADEPSERRPEADEPRRRIPGREQRAEPGRNAERGVHDRLRNHASAPPPGVAPKPTTPPIERMIRSPPPTAIAVVASTLASGAH